MTLEEESERIVPPVDIPPADQVRPGAVNPAALSVEQLARMLGVPARKVQGHVDAGAPTRRGGLNLVHYVAWLNRELARTDGD